MEKSQREKSQTEKAPQTEKSQTEIIKVNVESFEKDWSRKLEKCQVLKLKIH